MLSAEWSGQLPQCAQARFQSVKIREVSGRKP